MMMNNEIPRHVLQVECSVRWAQIEAGMRESKLCSVSVSENRIAGVLSLSAIKTSKPFYRGLDTLCFLLAFKAQSMKEAANLM